MDQLSAFLHTDAWQRFQKAAGAEVEQQDDNLFLHRSLPLKGRYWYAPRCHMTASWKLPKFAYDSWFVRLEPEDSQSYENIIRFAHSNHIEIRKTLALQPRQTTLLDLSQGTDELLASMKSKHRYNIRLAEKHDVQTEFYTHNLSEQFPRFWKLLKETADRHTFRPHPRSYYEAMVKELEKDEMIHLGFATHEGQDLAAVLIITCGTVGTYLHGASTTQKKELMAPHLLHWRVICELKDMNITEYDFWGIHAQPTDTGWEPLTNHPSAGVTRFKLGFGGEVVEYPGCFDLILNPFCYTLYTTVRGFRSRKRAFS